MPILTLYHATRSEFDTLDPSKTVDGGLHFGSQDQARMRGGKKARMIEAQIEIKKPRRSKDMGGQWAGKIKSAKSAGHDSIVYLNRYEGLPLARVEEAIQDGVDLDRLTDTQFKRRVPEATDSYIVFSPSSVISQQAVTSHQSATEAPAVSLGTVTHVGTLNPAHKGEKGYSYEGAGLSFSVDPDAWVEIAELENKPWWKADLSGARILDGLACLKSPKIMEEIQTWAQEKGLASPVPMFKAIFRDTEDDQLVEFWCATQKQAREEIEDQDEGRVESSTQWVPSALLCARMGNSADQAGKLNPNVPSEMMMAWAEDHGWDGAWWNETLNPSSYSAPRGVIFPSKLTTVAWSPCKELAPAPKRRRASP